jgi:hypothetical protein
VASSTVAAVARSFVGRGGDRVLLRANDGGADLLPAEEARLVAAGDAPAHNPAMITRVWRGWTTADDPDAYERFLMG